MKVRIPSSHPALGLVAGFQPSGLEGSPTSGPATSPTGKGKGHFTLPNGSPAVRGFWEGPAGKVPPQECDGGGASCVGWGTPGSAPPSRRERSELRRQTAGANGSHIGFGRLPVAIGEESRRGHLRAGKCPAQEVTLRPPPPHNSIVHPTT